MNNTKSGHAVASLVFGCASMLCGPFLGIPAIILGIAALRKNKMNHKSGNGLAITGISTGLLGSIAFLVFVVTSCMHPRPVPGYGFSDDVTIGWIVVESLDTDSKSETFDRDHIKSVRNLFSKYNWVAWDDSLPDKPLQSYRIEVFAKNGQTLIFYLGSYANDKSLLSKVQSGWWLAESYGNNIIVRTRYKSLATSGALSTVMTLLEGQYNKKDVSNPAPPDK